MKNPHDFFMQVALLTATRSTCSRKQVGSILVKDNRIISSGYNGVLSGYQHCNEMEFGKIDWQNTKLTDRMSQIHHEFSVINELHAEQNVIAFAAKNGVATEGCSLYTTLAPCNDCSKLIAAAGIVEVFYLEEYDRCNSGIEFLKKHGISIKKVGAKC